MSDHPVAYGVKVTGSNAVLIVGDTQQEAEDYAEQHVQAGGQDLAVVRVTCLAVVGAKLGRQDSSGACYVCGRPRSAPSPHCPKASHAP